jgi:predicted heme/steroid binding protein
MPRGHARETPQRGCANAVAVRAGTMELDQQQVLAWIVAHPSVVITTWLAICAAAIFLLYKGLKDATPEPAPLKAGDNKKRELRLISREEVAKHAAEKDCWLIIDGKVYDVTSYVEEHPGGDSILNNAGRDSTQGFHGPQHPARVFDIIDDFCIGTLATS